MESARSTKRPFGVLVPGRHIRRPYKAYAFNRVLAEIRLRAAISRPYRAYAFIRVLAEIRLRADSIRPYRAYTLIRVLPEIRDYGRMLSAPTGVFLKLPPAHKKDEKPA